ncbi:MAG: alpha/beta hydrolase [Trichloromonas sp.]|jgi:pimeloyl-ACP methyl ester carboxylesterase|nr:alpha/beta hydrolase [Trichloromonas sp.]
MKATIHGISVAYDDIGAGPAIVLVHGFPLDRRMWQPQTAELVRAGYRVIVPDLRGFGESQVPANGWTLGHLAADLVGLLSYLGIGRAVFCGFAMGGSILLNLLEKHPDKVTGACFVSSRVRTDDILKKVRRSELVDKLAAGNREEVLAVLASELLGERPRPELAATLREWLELVDTRSLIWGLQAIRDRKDHSLGIREFFQPTLVISGNRDTLVSSEHGEHLAKEVPLGFGLEFDDTGHLVNLEQPERFNACLLDFLGGIRQKRHKRVELKEVA